MLIELRNRQGNGDNVSETVEQSNDSTHDNVWLINCFDHQCCRCYHKPCFKVNRNRKVAAPTRTDYFPQYYYTADCVNLNVYKMGAATSVLYTPFLILSQFEQNVNPVLLNMYTNLILSNPQYLNPDYGLSCRRSNVR